jgi:cytochrome c-type biogenesis protein CcsB
MPVSARDHTRGPADAPVTLVEYGDFQCPFCGAAFPIIEELLARMGHLILFAFRTDKLRELLPSLESLDSLMYKTACLAFAGLAMLLITGAIWANESWGRPWGFDSKETGALVAWLTYAAFLHTRISRGWKGRSSAYFAVVGFLLVIFTYLGVSYLLKGLHSYA